MQNVRPPIRRSVYAKQVSPATRSLDVKMSTSAQRMCVAHQQGVSTNQAATNASVPRECVVIRTCRGVKERLPNRSAAQMRIVLASWPVRRRSVSIPVLLCHAATMLCAYLNDMLLGVGARLDTKRIKMESAPLCVME